MSLVNTGSWYGSNANANTYWGLTRVVGPYKPTKYDEQISKSQGGGINQGFNSHQRVVEFRPPPYIPDKPVSTLYEYATHDVVTDYHQTVPYASKGIVGRMQKGDMQRVGNRNMPDASLARGKLQSKYEGFRLGGPKAKDNAINSKKGKNTEGFTDKNPGPRIERTPFYFQEITKLNKGRGETLGKRTGFHANDMANGNAGYKGILRPSYRDAAEKKDHERHINEGKVPVQLGTVDASKRVRGTDYNDFSRFKRAEKLANGIKNKSYSRLRYDRGTNHGFRNMRTMYDGLGDDMDIE